MFPTLLIEERAHLACRCSQIHRVHALLFGLLVDIHIVSNVSVRHLGWIRYRSHRA